MKQAVFGTAAGMAMIASTITSAHAAPLGLGTPGTKTCRGQSEAYLAQFGKSVDLPGLAAYAKLAGLPVQTIQQFVDAFCSAG